MLKIGVWQQQFQHPQLQLQLQQDRPLQTTQLVGDMWASPVTWEETLALEAAELAQQLKVAERVRSEQLQLVSQQDQARKQRSWTARARRPIVS